MSRTKVFIHEDRISDALRPLKDGPLARESAETSYYLMRKLVERGFVEYSEAEKTPGRGRRSKRFSLTPKGHEHLDSIG